MIQIEKEITQFSRLTLDHFMSDISAKQVLVCQNRTCRKQGSAEVLAAFQAASVADVTVKGTGCFGQCGKGPMVIILPEEVWYDRVHPDEVATIVEQHLRVRKPVKGSKLPENADK